MVSYPSKEIYNDLQLNKWDEIELQSLEWDQFKNPCNFFAITCKKVTRMAEHSVFLDFPLLGRCWGSG